ncbi:hypothetical protein P170DRAFT_211429 [Aspergillus steynii IBT 23096]|uniref:Uncharacterized protein n=1 Tax=Aspergillus steynii IBT 23096 TaxID=1392250 RepID=A0A2I2G677_9EURO|nr:uncharacterized protein P170DRAFT_211429 [Aspergillus steynii IBT 23096]PLB48386.1 hypothetical protein P170DRAFT_211429 [Aspergillus steynii IBT 23096]
MTCYMTCSYKKDRNLSQQIEAARYESGQSGHDDTAPRPRIPSHVNGSPGTNQRSSISYLITGLVYLSARRFRILSFRSRPWKGLDLYPQMRPCHSLHCPAEQTFGACLLSGQFRRVPAGQALATSYPSSQATHTNGDLPCAVSPPHVLASWQHFS